MKSSLSDHQRVLAGLAGENISAAETDLNVLKKLPQVLRENDFRLKAVTGRIDDLLILLDVREDQELSGNLIIIIDIGTTTIKAQLVDCTEQSIKILGNQSCFNSQGAFGRDVTARIIYSEKAGPQALQKAVLDDINTLIISLLENAEGAVRPADIYGLVCAGNTVMTHLLLGLPARSIRRSPYVPVTLKPPAVRAGDLGININPAGLVCCVPGISGWVGGDISAGILVTGIHKSAELCLLVDLGTNGEIVLGNREWMVATSASAGPALEGANEECGMQAIPGAIERVYLDKGEIRYGTIGGQAPLGICGSGIIDLVSVMLEAGIINRSGRLIEAKAFADRIREKEGIKEFILCEKAGRKGKIFLSEPDIENIISAKAAIFAAIKILVRRFELDFSKITHLFLAGAFGNYLNVKSAVDIGLIPHLPESRLHFAGNTSLLGARMAALSGEAEKTLLAISENTTYFDLMGEEDYVEEFKKALFLPHTDLELFQNNERKKSK
jgi:uncharacterized 2Fe-2S/4Fe-4S cluster protein (DUF4445 family)